MTKRKSLSPSAIPSEYEVAMKSPYAVRMAYFKKKEEERKAITKAHALKLKPGAIIEIWWLDAPNTYGILLEQIERGRGEQSVKVLHENGVTNNRVVHTQIVRASNMNILNSQTMQDFKKGCMPAAPQNHL